MIATRAALLGLILVFALTSEASPRRRAARPADTSLEIHALAGYDPSITTTADLAPFRDLVGDATVVGLGESWHTSGGFYLLKHRLFRYLVEEMGFRAFAMESNWEAVERTNAYVQTCSGTAEMAIREENPVWQSTEYANLVRWMCEWNRAHPGDRVTTFGFDIQQPDRDGPALAQFMAQQGVPASDPRVNGLRSCEGAFGLSHPFGEIPPSVHATCIGALDGIETFLYANRASIDADAFLIAILRVIGLRANQEQVFAIRDDFAKGFNYRDAAMAYAFHTFRAMKAPNAKTVVWAADIHVAQNELPNGAFSLGGHLESAFGADYVSFAITAYESEQARGSGVCGLAARAPGSAEEKLAAYGHPAMLARPKDGVRQYQVQQMGFFPFRPFADFDAIFFLAHSPAMHPLTYPGCR